MEESIKQEILFYIWKNCKTSNTDLTMRALSLKFGVPKKRINRLLVDLKLIDMVKSHNKYLYDRKLLDFQKKS